METDTLEILNSYFKENPNWVVKHHLDSYNDFVKNKIPMIFKNKNKTAVILYDKEDKDIEYKFDVFIGGKEGINYSICAPVLHDYETGTNKQLYPNEARLKNLTYAFDIFYDAEIEVSMKRKNTVIIDKQPLKGEWLKNNYLGNIPIMVNSNMCILNKLPKKAYPMVGESEFEVGGYFILDGAEKVVISQERKAENMIYTIEMNDMNYIMNTIVKSKSDESFDLARDNVLYLDHKGYITVCIGPYDKPFIRRTEFDHRFVPLFVIFRILGVESDKEILEMILGEDINNEANLQLLNLLRPSIQDPTILNYKIYDKQSAELFLEPLTNRSMANVSSGGLNEFKKNREKRLAFLYDTIYENILPHCGTNFHNKAMFLGLMVKKLLMTKIGLLVPTNRDSYMNKRFDVSGVLLAGLFKRAFERGVVYNASRMIKTIFEYTNTPEHLGENIINLINEDNINRVFAPEAFRKYFNDDLKIGNIGLKKGVIQQMERISYYNAISQLRRVVLPIYGGRVTNERRHVQCTQFGYICCNESPEGGKIGLTLALALLSTITIGYPPQQLRELCIKLGTMELHTLSVTEAHKLCKLIINGNWIGGVLQPEKIVEKLKLMRRNGLINTMTSISWYNEDNEIYIYCDDGRLSRPLYIYEDNQLNLKQSDIQAIKSGKMNFSELLTSKLPFSKDIEPYNPNNYKVMKPDVLGLSFNDKQLWDKLKQNSAAIEYLDIKEMDNALLTLNYEINPNDQYKYSHADLHPIVMLGYMGLYGILLNHGQGGKYLASGASKHPKQSVSTYTTAFQYRFDTSAHLLHNPERPIIQNRFHHAINNHVHGTGNNVVVAVSYNNGYNQEDAFIFNKSSIEMGLFNSSYYKTYESSEKKEEKTGTEERFYNPLYANEIDEYPLELYKDKEKPQGHYTYEYLDKYGIIKEGTYLKGHEIIIGKYAKVVDGSGKAQYMDLSSHTKPDNKFSVVDKVYTCKSNNKGDEICKVRTCQLRIPTFGDKFASRNGQKGTIAMLNNKWDMPATSSGITPDIIMHPGSYPKRMTLNQLFEVLYGKLAVKMGFFGEANSLETFDIRQINDIMEANGFEYGGDEFMYDGISGKMLPYKIFIGPMYVQRLKLMVNDKINSRTEGQRRNGIPIPGAKYTTTDRAVVEGRAAGGGLKIGEMERDAIIGHGVASVLYDRDMIRGDKFPVFVSPINGQIVVGNEYDNIYYDDLADGPIGYQLAEGTGEGKRSILGINSIHNKQHNFKKVNIPYSTKLLIHELQGAGYNIKLRPEIRKIMIDAEKLSEEVNSSSNNNKDLDISTKDLIIKKDDLTKDFDLNNQFNLEENNEVEYPPANRYTETEGEGLERADIDFIRSLNLTNLTEPVLDEEEFADENRDNRTLNNISSTEEENFATFTTNDLKEIDVNPDEQIEEKKTIELDEAVLTPGETELSATTMEEDEEIPDLPAKPKKQTGGYIPEDFFNPIPNTSPELNSVATHQEGGEDEVKSVSVNWG